MTPRLSRSLHRVVAALLAVSVGPWASATFATVASLAAAGGVAEASPSRACASRGCACGRHEAGAKCCCAGKEAPAGPAFSADCVPGDDLPAAPAGGFGEKGLPPVGFETGGLSDGRRLAAGERPLAPSSRPSSPLDAVPRLVA